jgi:signal transduction histidine kinase
MNTFASQAASTTATSLASGQDRAEAGSLAGRWLLTARVGFIAVFVTVVILNLVALPSVYASLVTPSVVSDLRRLGMSQALYSAIMMAQYGVEALVYLAMGLLIFWRRSDERMALFCALTLVTFGALAAGPLDDMIDSAVPMPQPLASIPFVHALVRLLAVAGQVSILTFFYVFPSGRFVPRWTRWFSLLALVYWAAAAFFPALSSGPAGNLLFVFLAVATIAQVYRYRYVSGATERAQTRWVVFGFVLMVVIVAAAQIAFALAPEDFQRTAEASPALGQLFGLRWTVALMLIPISIAIAILRARLWDIDLIINRTLVYSALTVSVVALYVVVVGYLGALFRGSDNLIISLLTTGLIAVLFQPLRSWLQRGVNRLTYGQRDEPYAVVAQLGRRMQGALDPEAVLPAIVETVAQALKLSYAAITLKQGNEFMTAAAHGSPVEGTLMLPLTYQAEPVGQLLLGPRQRGEGFTPADRRLLEDLARQVGVAAHAVRLTADLQRSREQLVTSREEERRRLRRDLHDGLGSALTSLMFKLDAADTLLDSDPSAARALLAAARGQMQASIADIRRLVYDLRPPILDEWGLVEALRERVAQYALNDVRVTIEAPEALPPLPAAVEVAAYRIALEALANVVKHAHATTCAIRIALAPEALTLETRDDGVGRGDSPLGVGLIAMRERATELGGSLVVEDAEPHGTRVRARFPLRMA